MQHVYFILDIVRFTNVLTYEGTATHTQSTYISFAIFGDWFCHMIP